METMVICRCEEITLDIIRDCIKTGVHTPREVKLCTRAGMGICQGRTCGPMIEQLLASSVQERNLAPTPIKHRFPVRPILISEISALSKEGGKK